jgi:hypothetical protein
MANKNNDDFFALLRARGLRKKVARSIAALDGTGRRAGASGEKLARQTVEDLTAAVGDIRKRVLRRDRSPSQAAQKAAGTRRRNATKRSTSAQKAARTRSRNATQRSTTAKKAGQTRATARRTGAKAKGAAR